MTRSGYRAHGERGLLSDPIEEPQNHQNGSQSIPQPPPNWPLNGENQPMDHSISIDGNEDSDGSAGNISMVQFYYFFILFRIEMMFS